MTTILILEPCVTKSVRVRLLGKDGVMLAITRFRPVDPVEFDRQAQALLAELARCEGMLEAQVARAVDDPGIFALVSRWQAAGHYRRALGRVAVRMLLLPMSLDAIDEPGAYEEVLRLADGLVVQGEPDVVDGPWLSAREAGEGDWIG